MLDCHLMTRDNRVVLSLDEIRALRWTCGTCGVSITFPLDRTMRWPERCPACHGLPPQTADAARAEEAMRRFITALQQAVGASRDPQVLGATIGLEFVEPAAR